MEIKKVIITAVLIIGITMPKNVFAISPQSTDYLKALDLEHDRQYVKAEKLLEKLATDKEYVLGDYVFHELAGIYEKIKKTEKAKEQYKKISQIYPDSIFCIEQCTVSTGTIESSGMNRVKELYYEGDINTAIKYLALLDPSSPEVSYYFGMSYLRKGNAVKAIEYFSKILAEFPLSDFSRRAKYRMAKYYDIAGMSDLARPLYKELILKDPESDQAINSVFDLGFPLYREGKYKDAYEVFGAISKRSERIDYSRALFWQAKCAEKLGSKTDRNRILSMVTFEAPWTYYGFRAFQNVSTNYWPTREAIKDDISSRLSTVVNNDRHFLRFIELTGIGLYQDSEEEAKAIVDKKLNQACLAYSLYGQDNYREAINVTEPNEEGDEYLGLLLSELSYPKGFEIEVNIAAAKYSIDPYLLFALIREESRFDPDAVSRARAHGLTQIMPKTGKLIAKQIKLRHFKTKKLLDPEINVGMGALYLSDMINTFHGDVFLALAAYNAGPGNVSKWLKKLGYSDMDEFVENIPIKETRLYVQKVIGSYWQYKRLYMK